jgi:poly-gamma-glutamate capsule biosynthesis protein CapA/YwtB (metallophosphatase superfamily)
VRRAAGALWATLGCLAALLAGCAPTPVSTAPASPVSVAPAPATPLPAAPASATPAAPTPALDSWQELYTRPGWAGGPALDLRAVGDVMLGRNVAELAARRGGGYPFEEAAPLLAGDLTVGNLESPLSGRRDELRPGPYRLTAPPELAPALAAAGFDLLGLANNHGLDAGPAGLADTRAALGEAGVAAAGAGSSEAAALAPIVLEAAGLRVALLAFNDVLDPADPAHVLASAGDLAWRPPDFAGCPPPAEACPTGRAWLSAAALDAVDAARKRADAVAVLVHWGVEYAPQPSARQRAWASRLVAAGADLVLGAHPHVLQPAEAVSAGGRHGFVAYSLGNFVFDGPADPAVSSGVVLRVLLDHDGVASVAAAPLATAGGQPRPLDPDGEAGNAALAALEAAPRPATPSPASTVHAPAEATTDGPAAWRWDGQQGRLVAAPAGMEPPAPPTRLPADLRGDGEPLWAELDEAGVVTLRDGPGPDAPVVWRNEDPAWRFTQIVAGDPNDDGRVELAMLLWQPDEAGVLRAQPYLLGWRGGRYRIIWGGSATETPIQRVAIADLEGDGRAELLVLEGGAAPGDLGEHVSVWRWHGWGFQLEWRSPAGKWSAAWLHDLDGDGRPEILASPSLRLSSAPSAR